MKEAVGLKDAERVFDSNQCVRKSTGGRSSMRVMTNSKCMADELHLRYNDRQAEQKLSKRGYRWCTCPQLETENRVKGLDRFAMVMGIFKSGNF